MYCLPVMLLNSYVDFVALPELSSTAARGHTVVAVAETVVFWKFLYILTLIPMSVVFAAKVKLFG